MADGQESKGNFVVKIAKSMDTKYVIIEEKERLVGAKQEL